jgi:hypothetical protein
VGRLRPPATQCSAPGLSTLIQLKQPESPIKQLYLEWIEDQIESYKDSVSRSDLIRIAEEAVEELRITRRGQYQLTEVLLCAAVDRKIFQLLNLPSYRQWCGKDGDPGGAELDDPLLIPPMP